jgi:hypothetical protein
MIEFPKKSPNLPFFKFSSFDGIYIKNSIAKLFFDMKGQFFKKRNIKMKLLQILHVIPNMIEKYRDFCD